MYFMYLIVYIVAYSVYLPPIGRRRSVKKYCARPAEVRCVLQGMNPRMRNGVPS